MSNSYLKTRNRHGGWQYGCTLLTECAVLLSQLLLYKIVAALLGKVGFSEYAVARRVTSLIQPLLLLGLGVGLPRYVAVADSRGDTESGHRCFNATLVVTGTTTLICLLAIGFLGGELSFLFFADAQHRVLLPSLWVMLAGLTFHSVVYSYLRGQLAMGRANALQFVNMSIVPLLVLAARPVSARAVLLLTGTGWTLFALITSLLATPLWDFNLHFYKELRVLLRYGIQRVPGDFAYTALYALPAMVVTHLGGLGDGGMAALAISIVSMITAIFAPVGVILLPKVSRSVGQGNLEELRQEIMLLRKVSVIIPAVLIVAIEFGANMLLRGYLGPNFESAAQIVRVSCIAAVPLSFFCATRSVMDAAYDNAKNTANLLMALAVLVCCAAVCILVHAPQIVFLWSFVFSTAVLAVLTDRDLQKLLRSAHAAVRPISSSTDCCCEAASTSTAAD